MPKQARNLNARLMSMKHVPRSCSQSASGEGGYQSMLVFIGVLEERETASFNQV